MKVHEMIEELKKVHNQEAEIIFRASEVKSKGNSPEMFDIDRVTANIHSFVIIEGSPSI